eukprot:scaffold51_cov401-Prasinococcus_capsulatus_cf.AAC.24
MVPNRLGGHTTPTTRPSIKAIGTAAPFRSARRPLTACEDNRPSAMWSREHAARPRRRRATRESRPSIRPLPPPGRGRIYHAPLVWSRLGYHSPANRNPA